MDRSPRRAPPTRLGRPLPRLPPVGRPTAPGWPHPRLRVTNPGKIVILNRAGHVSWSFGATSGADELDKPSLAIRLPKGLIAPNDDYNHRVIVIDPANHRIVWQYGHTGIPGSAPAYLDNPDGIDLAPKDLHLP